MMTSLSPVTELEARLQSPGGAALLAELSLGMCDLENRLRARIAAGTPRKEFPAWKAAINAASAAREILACYQEAITDGPSASSSSSPFLPLRTKGSTP